MGMGTVDSRGICRALEKVAAALEAHSEEVGELDAKVGDGDLGVTLNLAAGAIGTLAGITEETDVGKLLAQCGLVINRASPSTFGTIMASGFMGGGKAVTGKTSLELADLVTLGEAAVEAMKTRGKAEVGDRTVLDALVPAVQALADEQEKGSDLSAAMRAAVGAAEQGAKATSAMVAKRGRAKVFGERNLGVQDGGATAVFYMIEAFADSLDELQCHIEEGER